MKVKTLRELRRSARLLRRELEATEAARWKSETALYRFREAARIAAEEARTDAAKAFLKAHREVLESKCHETYRPLSDSISTIRDFVQILGGAQ